MKAFLFVLRHMVRRAAIGVVIVVILENVRPSVPGWVHTVIILGFVFHATFRAFSHVRRVELITDRTDFATLGSRHRRQIEMPMPPDEAFAIVDGAIRELPYVEMVEAARDSLQVRARVKRMDPYITGKYGRKRATGADGARRNQVLAIVTPGERTSSLLLVCEPEGGPWVDWFMVDDGTNLENIDAITRAITRRIGERRKGEENLVRETAEQKELTVAKLSLLQAQVEPHFLYNTLASAQLLTRSDPARADQMLGNLIVYLRHSLPRTEGTLSTLAQELESAPSMFMTSRGIFHYCCIGWKARYRGVPFCMADCTFVKSGSISPI
jgi:hypothetical protein